MLLERERTRIKRETVQNLNAHILLLYLSLCWHGHTKATQIQRPSRDTQQKRQLNRQVEVNIRARTLVDYVFETYVSSLMAYPVYIHASIRY